MSMNKNCTASPLDTRHYPGLRPPLLKEGEFRASSRQDSEKDHGKRIQIAIS